jgi:capsular polysaccharide export protein
MMNKLQNISGKNILLLQGPMGSFFKRLDLAFRAQGATTWKVGLNAGDRFYSNRDNYIPFRERPYQWKAFIHDLMYDKMIDILIVFGDCRFYQRIARSVAQELAVDVIVFEEGYVRPDYITMERYGVNDFSHISRDADFYRSLDPKRYPADPPLPADPKIFHMMGSAALYYIIGNLLLPWYPHYRHHRSFSALNEAFVGIRNLFRKQCYKMTEKGFEQVVETYMSKQYYFVPLQTHNDFQIQEHSPYDTIEKFIAEVLESFARHAPKNSFLLIKHHPMDRGRRDYEAFIRSKAETLGVLQRIVVVYDVHLPMLLKHAVGTITINSTVGLSSVWHGTPTLVTGSAIYDIEGITCRGMALDVFWRDFTPPNPELLERYRTYLIANTQLNGSFFGRFPVELAGGDAALAEQLSL